MASDEPRFYLLHLLLSCQCSIAKQTSGDRLDHLPVNSAFDPKLRGGAGPDHPHNTSLQARRERREREEAALAFLRQRSPSRESDPPEQPERAEGREAVVRSGRFGPRLRFPITPSAREEVEQRLIAQVLAREARHPGSLLPPPPSDQPTPDQQAEAAQASEAEEALSTATEAGPNAKETAEASRKSSRSPTPSTGVKEAAEVAKMTAAAAKVTVPRKTATTGVVKAVAAHHPSLVQVTKEMKNSLKTAKAAIAMNKD
ncbi:hypothetical protein QBC34DRAFT_470176 [Podospora aff. communis PSN243]|uniref:Uncharacterized protein n=1 Tax=Podospora aff. communis PSN243 TaxID=3040156 RepID=A0AAV9GDS8_9PEZI|nr:hypothetical protein QBC34DRAFT_470176 [Podospora aff. communis PSN243]